LIRADFCHTDLLSKEHQPQEAGGESDDAWIEERQWVHLGFELKAEEQGANNKGKDDARYKANHPHWKK
jgi:hypothetical protein